MRSTFIFLLILLLLGWLVGDRYGLPGAITNMTDQGFEKIESYLPGAADAGDAAEDAAEDTAAAADAPAAVPNQSPAAPASSDLGSALNAGLTMNEAGLQIIKDSEGLRLEAYEAGGRWYIGYGHAATAKAGMRISEAQADKLLRSDVRAAEAGVKRLVTVELNRNQFSALVSFAYNLGVGGFERSRVLEKLNVGDYGGAADAFLSHNRARINGELTPIPHLTERREKERALFLTRM